MKLLILILITFNILSQTEIKLDNNLTDNNNKSKNELL